MERKEATARTLLNMHLVVLHQHNQAQALLDPISAHLFVSELLHRDERIKELFSQSSIESQALFTSLQESLDMLSRAGMHKLVPMLVPVPPDLSITMGYTGQGRALLTNTLRDARYLGFYWMGGKVYWEDGLGGQTDSWQGYLSWLYHWRIWSSLGSWSSKLGSDDGDPATHEWVLDRKTRLIFLASIPDARPFLRCQWPKEAFCTSLSLLLARQIQSERRMLTEKEVWLLYQAECHFFNEVENWLLKYWPSPPSTREGLEQLEALFSEATSGR